MNPTILIFNLPKKQQDPLRIFGLRYGMRVVSVTPERFGHTLEALLSDALPEPILSAGFTDKMLVMCGLPDFWIDLLLQYIQQERINIPLKAVLTDTNRSWTAVQLHRELCREREAIAAGTQVHTQTEQS